MKMFSLALIVSIFGSLSFAMSIPDARKATALVAAETDLLIGSCDSIASSAAKIKFELSTIAAGLNEFAVGPNSNIESAVRNIDLGISAVEDSLVECINFDRYGGTNNKLLLDLYLLHTDIDLMIAEHGVGPDLKRQR